MRSSLSCAFCRKSKIKCVNTGSPPCQKCQKSDIPDCALTRPRNIVTKVSRRRGHLRRREEGRKDDHEQQTRPPPDSSDHGHDRPHLAPESFSEEVDISQIDEHLASLPTSVILKSLNVFTNKFPELGILHLPTLMQAFQTACSKETKVLLGVTLLVTKTQLSLLNPSWATSLLPSKRYEFYIRQSLSELILQPPDIQVVQALLIMSLYEWGCRDFHKAWVYCGIAIRIMQSIQSRRIAPYPLDMDISPSAAKDTVAPGIENRTIWACFIMDRMISSGTYNPPMLPMSEMDKLKISRPLSTVEFAFGTNVSLYSAHPGQNLSWSERLPSGLLDITQCYEILVSGFDIWAQVMTFIFNDGRRAPGMCAPENCPWVPGSPWSKTKAQLERWRAGQHDRLHYPSNSVAIHMTLGYGESFTYINLLYYLSTLMLHREYFPFIPTTESGPRGPVDHPLLEAEAPVGWWESSALELFSAAEHIARLLHEASECGAHLMTPFVGFCAFSASYMNLYIYRFPRMNLGRTPEAEQLMNFCLAYLEEFRHVWKLGEAWVSTLTHASLLYERASANRGRYLGKSREDFDHLHQSIHEFRVVDRSNQHIQEIEGAEGASPEVTYSQPVQRIISNPELDNLSAPLTHLLTEVSNYSHEQGAWSQWWPTLEDIDLALASA
ncbi:hypothetical protein BDV26DRAFT_278475 [Aspergillus bertholletiae]|uniref:Zn(2)-C6 fungal-type domain-containing protein n=1 Tax=Aspergillus bertholletiae TaxID=1226010 RepID=A0A5N7BJ97_9EURO|nr:hypothetical protein BDV26DRAFT_278475 [Aspergillus bertholletiae]